MTNRYSIASGLASAPSTWDGGLTVPVSGDRVLICAGHTVTLDGTFEWGDDSTATVVINAVSTTASIWVAGTLKASRTVSSQLTCNGAIRTAASTTAAIDYGRSLAGSGVDDPIVNVTATLITNKSATMVTCKYGLYVDNNAAFWCCGAAKNPNSTLQLDATAGTNSITVDQVSGWMIGDTVVITTTSLVLAETEEKIIQSIDTSGANPVVTFTTNLTYLHKAQGIAGNFSSTVVFTSFDQATNPGYTAHYWTYTQPANTREYKYTLFKNIGSEPNGGAYYGLSLVANSSPYAYLCVPQVDGCMFYGRGNAKSSGLYCGQMRVGYTVNDCAGVVGFSAGAASFASGIRSIFNRCYSYGAAYGYRGPGATSILNDCKFLGCATPVGSWGGAYLELNRCLVGASNIAFMHVVSGAVNFNNCDIGATFPFFNGANAGTLQSSGINSQAQITFNDCLIGSSVTVSLTVVPTRLQDCTPDTYYKFSNKNLDPLQQEVWTPGGVITRDNTFAKDVSGSSLKMAPYNAAAPFSFSLQVYAPNNKPVAVSGYIFANAAYGTTNPVTVTLSGLGITPSVWTEANTRDAWQQFLVGGTNSTGADGMLTLTVTVQSAAGAVWVDGVSAPTPTAINSGEFGYWSNGLPAPVVSANYVAVSDVWNAATSGMTLPGSIGAALTAPGGVGGVSGVSVGDAWNNMLVRGSGSAPPAADIAVAVRFDLATELARMDATISSRLSAAGYTPPMAAPVPPSAAAIADAVWNKTLP